MYTSTTVTGPPPVEKVVDPKEPVVVDDVEVQNLSGMDDVNVSGHAQELDRQFGLLSICATGIVTGNTWTALGGAIVSDSVEIPCFMSNID